MNRAGVTLIELVVGLTIASAVLTAGYAALSTTLDRRERVVTDVEEQLGAAATRAALRVWLSGAVVAPESSAPLFSGADGVHQDLPDDRLSFLTSAPTPLGARRAQVTLYIDRSPETPERGLVADISEWLGVRRRRIELVPDALGLDVSFRSRLLSGRPWHPSWISSTVMPAGIEVSVTGPQDALHPLLSLPLRVALEGGR